MLGPGKASRAALGVDTAKVVWSEATGLCGFWAGSCENGTCGAGIMIQVFTKTWVSIHKRCAPTRGRNSLDAELGGCGLLMDNLNQWIKTL